MDYLLSIERILLADFAKSHAELQTIEDKTLKGLAFLYGYDVLHHALHLLKHPKRTVLYQTKGSNRRCLYQFQANKNQVSVYSLSTSNFCTCQFYKEHILNKQDYFACPHNVATKLHEQLLQSNKSTDIETFEVNDDYLINKMARIIEQSREAD